VTAGERQFWSVIPAGGAGTRLWPLSRTCRPKFLLPLLGERSLLQQTWDRVIPFSTPERTLVVAGPAHAAEIARQLPGLPAENLIIEPAPRGTGPAIGLAALLIRKRDPEAVMGSFAADHVVEHRLAFAFALGVAREVAEAGWLVTIGLTPTRPETGYGYIERTDEVVVQSPAGVAYRAAGFTEKPDIDRARAFLASGQYSWNASMFIWRVDRIAEELERHLPALSTALGRILSAWSDPEGSDTLAREWSGIDTVTIDHGVMERCDRVAVVPVEMGWSDVGDWHGLGELLPQDSESNALHGNALVAGATGNIVWSTTDRLIALVGVEDLAVVDTPDAVLVLRRERAQDVREIVRQLTGERESHA
jgi:mannose-1-phosphate guanylyltransferase